MIQSITSATCALGLLITPMVLAPQKPKSNDMHASRNHSVPENRCAAEATEGKHSSASFPPHGRTKDNKSQAKS